MTITAIRPPAPSWQPTPTDREAHDLYLRALVETWLDDNLYVQGPDGHWRHPGHDEAIDPTVVLAGNWDDKYPIFAERLRTTEIDGPLYQRRAIRRAQGLPSVIDASEADRLEALLADHARQLRPAIAEMLAEDPDWLLDGLLALANKRPKQLSKVIAMLAAAGGKDGQ